MGYAGNNMIIHYVVVSKNEMERRMYYSNTIAFFLWKKHHILQP